MMPDSNQDQPPPTSKLLEGLRVAGDGEEVTLGEILDPPVPGWVHRRTIKRKHLDTAVRKTRRIARWLDRISSPRFPRLAAAAMVAVFTGAWSLVT